MNEGAVKASILVLGSMEETERGGSGTVLAPSTRTRRLGEAVEELAVRLGIAEAISIDTPDAIPAGGIVNEVFSRIDTVDLCIIDLSGYRDSRVPSPNVIYEIALCDALGVARVLVTDGSADLPFYLSQDKCIGVADYSADELEEGLKPILLAAAGQEPLRADLLDVPFTRFYGAALVNVSAAVGVAVTYWQNYVHALCGQGGSLEMEENKGGPVITELVVALPDTLRSHHEGALRQLAQQLAQIGESAGALHGGTLNTTLARGTAKARTAMVLGGVAVDLPRTLWSLHNSPRYRRISSGARNVVAARALPSDRGEVQGRIERSLLRHFVDALQDQIDHYREPLSAEITLLPISDVPAYVRQKLG